ncbi:MAG: site-specific DNA-methyltransferase [Ahniella sp.]|nr:site-specific DNA-methyltransferase [Ahniella sp.]
MARAIEMWPLQRLVPYERNPRTHSPEQVTKIAASIEQFGFNNPLLVDSQDGIIAGHGRLLAARQLGLGEVPVIVLDHLTDAQRRAYVIADNKLAELAGWDDELLALELATLDGEDFPLDVIGFTDQELAAMLDGDPDEGAREAEDEVPPAPAAAVSRPGDLWLCGEHRVLCGDATVEADIERLLGGQRAAMVFTDPPYNVDYHGADGASIQNDNLGSGFEAFLQAAIGNLLRAVEGAVYVCMSSSELATLQKVFIEAGGHWSTFVIWAKNAFTLGRSDYHRQYEPILYGWPEGQSHYWCGARDQGDVWLIAKPAHNDLHPTMKPVELVRRAIQNSSPRDAVILDPFGGSGTTLIASQETGRRARLLELDPRFVDVIVRRWETFTGLQATLEDGGGTFGEIREQRGGGDQ